MALHWDVTKLRNQETLFLKNAKGEEVLDPVIETLIWCQMFTCNGGKITEGNCEEVFRRVWIWERVFGTFIHDKVNNKPRPITFADVKRCVGLETNCFGDEGKRQFKDRVMKALFDEAGRKLRKEKEVEGMTTVEVMEDSGAS